MTRADAEDTVRSLRDRLARADSVTVTTLRREAALLRAAGYGTPHARPDAWADPVPRVLDDDLDGFRCACGVPTLPDVTHSDVVCVGWETLGDKA